MVYFCCNFWCKQRPNTLFPIDSVLVLLMIDTVIMSYFETKCGVFMNCTVMWPLINLDKESLFICNIFYRNNAGVEMQTIGHFKMLFSLLDSQFSSVQVGKYFLWTKYFVFRQKGSNLLKVIVYILLYFFLLLYSCISKE